MPPSHQNQQLVRAVDSSALRRRPGCGASPGRSQNMDNRQGEHIHDRDNFSATTSHETESSAKVDLRVGVELKAWETVRNLAGWVRWFSPGQRGAEADETVNNRTSNNNNTNNTACLVRPAPAVGRPWFSADHARDVIPPLPPRPLDEDAVLSPTQPLWLGATSARNAARWFCSLLASVALAFQTAEAQASGVDWRSASRGLDLIFDAGREYIGHPDTDYNPDGERLAYFHGVLLLLRGLPDDLEPAEAAMLHHAMPGAAVELTTGPRNAHAHAHGGQRQRGTTTANETPAVQTWMQAATFWFLCFARDVGALLWSLLFALGRQAVLLEQKHGSLTWLIITVAGFLRVLFEGIQQLVGTKTGQAVLQLADCTSQGVAEGIQEFARMLLEPERELEQHCGRPK
ncbi:hypothetical protein VTK26DRAFT_3819 [Humicola hyalothermophila]